MRKTEKEIPSRPEIDEVITSCDICRVGFCDKSGRPYVLPFCFGYDGEALYVHSATEGTKLDILAENNQVCFEMECDVEFRKAPEACRWGLKYRSVVGFGTADIISDPERKLKAFSTIMAHYSPEDYTFNPKAVERTVIIRICIDSVTGKKSGY